MVAFCTPDDVRKALQELDLSGDIVEANVTPAINAASRWFARATNGHWYDSSGSAPLSTSARSASDVELDVPSSPHRRDAQLYHDDARKYPTTRNGPYARLPLPHHYVESITTLNVRGPAGDYADWTTESDRVEGRGEDYYLVTPGQESYGRTYLHIRANSIGPRVDYEGLLSLGYDYGLDAQDTGWQDVRRGIASLAAAEVMDSDDVIAQIPDNGNLVGVQTQHDNLVNAAASYLNPYLDAMTVSR